MAPKPIAVTVSLPIRRIGIIADPGMRRGLFGAHRTVAVLASTS
jgi:hypothetical protein